MFMHRRDGRVRERDSYRNDPHPPTGYIPYGPGAIVHIVLIPSQ